MMGLQGRDMGGMGTQALCSDDTLKVRVSLAQRAKEAVGRIAFAILVGRPLVLHDRFRHQRHAVPPVGMDKRRAHHLMGLGDMPVAVHLLQT
jgi:hypothetical protein